MHRLPCSFETPRRAGLAHVGHTEVHELVGTDCRKRNIAEHYEAQAGSSRGSERCAVTRGCAARLDSPRRRSSARP